MLGILGYHQSIVAYALFKFIQQVETAPNLKVTLGDILRILVCVRDLFKRQIRLLVLLLGNKAYRVIIGLCRIAAGHGTAWCRRSGSRRCRSALDGSREPAAFGQRHFSLLQITGRLSRVFSGGVKSQIAAENVLCLTVAFGF